MSTKQKARVGVKIRDVVSGGSTNRSVDLDALTQRFNLMKKKIGVLAGALRRHHALMVEMNKSRVAIAHSVSAISEGTPLHKSAGALGNQDTSYAAVQQRLAPKIDGYASKYSQFVVDYLVEWDKVITTRVTLGLKATDLQRRDLDHYQRKVEELRTAANKLMAKGKQVDAKTQEKLSRNEEKFIKAKEAYNKTARDMCMVMEEVTDRSWKDLHPVLVKMAQFDMTLANDEAKALQELESVVTALKGLASTHDLKAAGRFKELETQEPSLLFTGSNSGSVATLTNGDISSSLGGLSLESQGDNSLPPGSVAPQGMGGFPVQINSQEMTMPRVASSTSIVSAPASSSNASWQNPSAYSTASAPSSGNMNWQSPSTSDMLAVAKSAAPPPTMEQLNDAYSYSDNASYGQPPPPPFSPPPPPPDTPPTGFYSASSPWSAPQPMAPTYNGGGMTSPTYSANNTNPFGPSTPTYGSSTNPFDGPSSGRPPTNNTNPFAY